MTILWEIENYNFTNYVIILHINIQCQFTSTTNKLIIYIGHSNTNSLAKILKY